MAAETAAAKQPDRQALSAQAVAIELLRDAAERRSESRELLHRLADGIATGTLSLEEVDRLLGIAQRLGQLGGGERQAAAPVDGDTARRAEAMLQNLEGVPDAVANGGGGRAPAAPARGRERDAAVAPPAVDEQAASGEPIATVSAVRKPDAEYPHTLVMFEGGDQRQLRPDQRLRILRDGQPLVDVVILKVDEQAAMGMVLDATWRDGAERAVRKGDRAAPIR